MSEKLPEVLYHASAFETRELMPGFKRTGVLVSWDKTESNQWLYASTDCEAVLSLGFASALEKMFLLDRFTTDGDYITIIASNPISRHELEMVDVHIYTIKPSPADGWVKNNNQSNHLTTEWKTQKTVQYTSREELDIGAWLKTKKITLKTQP